MNNPARTETIVIVGPGRAGISLGRLWQRAGHRVAAIVGGSADSAAQARAILGADVAVVPHAAALGTGTRMLLQAKELRLTHPYTGQPLHIVAPMDADICRCFPGSGEEAVPPVARP